MATSEDINLAIDTGFNPRVLAEAFGVLPTIRRDRFDLDNATYDTMRDTFETWRADLERAGR